MAKIIELRNEIILELRKAEKQLLIAERNKAIKALEQTKIDILEIEEKEVQNG